MSYANILLPHNFTNLPTDYISPDWSGNYAISYSYFANADQVNMIDYGSVMGGGDDDINAKAGNYIVSGGAGDDVILGGFGDDILYGGIGTNTDYGDGGNNYIDGGDGNGKSFIAAQGSGNIIV